MASWDDDEFDPEANFQPPTATGQVSDRWEGEDEPEDVKGAWDDDDDEENNGTGDENKVKAVQRKKKKKLEDIIKEKEEKRRQEMEEKRKAEEERLKALSPEAEIEERIRRQKLQEESDLQLAKEAFGVTDGGRVSIDSMYPKTEEEFKEFGILLKEKILLFEQSDYYVDFLDELFKACSLDLDAEHVKRLGTSLTAIASEKVKAQKVALKGKKKTKKAVLAGSGKSGKNADLDAYDMGGELDDFM
ncbi:eukaryotic translation initiation factor 3 subunit J-like isoform X1 [Amphiura filiformis]|uniref:eukaryotic translation initiation factor 3 subunit J-like isoform X1 n=1 Tax=Amphiura filiformis TaxID=82378 RepID=UPI003B21AC12